LQQGIVLAKDRLGHAWLEALEKAATWNFLYAPPRGVRLMLGVIFPSVDQIGREFPFLAFLLIDPEKVPLRRALLPRAFKEFLRATNRLVGRLRATQDWDAFRTEFGSTRWTAPLETRLVQASYEEYLNGVTAAEFYHGIGRPGDVTPAPEVFCSSLGESMRRVSDLAGSPPLALKFHLVKGEDEETCDVPFWLDLAATFKQDWAEPRTLFWTRGGTLFDPCLLACYGTPSPKIVQFLITPETECPDWIDPLSSSARMDQDGRDANQRRSEMACDSRASLEGVLERLRNVISRGPS
jgi:type VI secretion system ImpM family protein